MADERAVTIPINYLLLIGIMALLSAGMLLSTSHFVENQQDQTIRSELRVIGNRLATDLAATDRLASSVGAPGSVEIEVSLPGRVAGSTYWIEVASTGGDVYLITLTSTDPELSVTVPVNSRVGIATGAFDGGDVTVIYDTAGSGTLEVTNA